MLMTLDRLKSLKDDVGTQYNNLSSSIWVSERLVALKSQYDVLDLLVKEMESEYAPVADNPGRSKSGKNGNKRQQTIKS